MKKILHSKLAAFTIVELMVGLAMTNILLLIGFYGFELIQLQYRLYRSTSNEIASYQAFIYRLEIDAHTAQYMFLEDGYLAFQNNNQKIIYSLEANHVLRYRQTVFSQADTFPITVEWSASSLGAENRTTGLIDHLELDLFAFDETQKKHLFKSYSALDFMKNPTK